MNFWKNFKKIFSAANHKSEEEQHQAEAEAKEELLEHRVIDRSEAELDYFKQWEGSNVRSQMLDWINQQYNNYQNSCCCDCSISFMIIPSINGFVIHFNEDRWRPEDFRCLFDYFKSSLKKEKYWAHLSDYKKVQIGDTIETTERHYLKPPRQFGLEYGEKMDQKFGNIMISLNLVNEKIINLKFSATHYNDHLYHPARGFTDLIDCLCAK
jgi:hypothetical protein